jgi:outer membrane biosynthesis protein TonB
MSPGSIISGVFHIALAVLVVFGLPVFMKPLPEPELPSTVEVVTMAPKATAPEFTKPPVPKLPDPPKPDVKAEPTPPAPKAAAAEPQKTPDPTPTPPAPPKAVEPKPEPLPEKVEAIKPKEEPKKEEPKKEPPKPAEVKKPEKDRFDSVLDSVLKNRAPVRPTPPEQQAKPVQQAAVPQQRQTAPNLAEQLARSELDAVREKVRPCWNFPAGAPNPEKLAVEIMVHMNPNGTVREASIYDRSRLNDPFYRAAAEAALRATLNPACQPFPLPPHKYNSWRSFSFIFDPRDL